MTDLLSILKLAEEKQRDSESDQYHRLLIAMARFFVNKNNPKGSLSPDQLEEEIEKFVEALKKIEKENPDNLRPLIREFLDGISKTTPSSKTAGLLHEFNAITSKGEIHGHAERNIASKLGKLSRSVSHNPFKETFNQQSSPVGIRAAWRAVLNPKLWNPNGAAGNDNVVFDRRRFSNDKEYREKILEYGNAIRQKAPEHRSREESELLKELKLQTALEKKQLEATKAFVSDPKSRMSRDAAGLTSAFQTLYHLVVDGASFLKRLKKNGNTNKPAAPATNTSTPQPAAPATNTSTPQPAAPATNTSTPQPAAPVTNIATPQPAAPVTNIATSQPVAPVTNIATSQPVAPVTNTPQNNYTPLTPPTNKLNVSENEKSDLASKVETKETTTENFDKLIDIEERELSVLEKIAEKLNKFKFTNDNQKSESVAGSAIGAKFLKTLGSKGTAVLGGGARALGSLLMTPAGLIAGGTALAAGAIHYGFKYAGDSLMEEAGAKATAPSTPEDYKKYWETPTGKARKAELLAKGRTFNEQTQRFEPIKNFDPIKKEAASTLNQKTEQVKEANENRIAEKNAGAMVMNMPQSSNTNIAPAMITSPSSRGYGSPINEESTWDWYIKTLLIKAH